MKNEQKFIDKFLDFLNDETADARKAEDSFSRHPWVVELKLFQIVSEAKEYKALQEKMRQRMRWAKQHLVVKQKKEIVEELNRLALNIALKRQDGTPVLRQDGTELSLKVRGLARYQLRHGSIEIFSIPAVNGMEFACWYGLLLVSRQPDKVRRCHLPDCRRWYNAVTTKTVGYCTKEHGEEAERINSQIRSWNARHPDKAKTLIRSTAPKRRGKIDAMRMREKKKDRMVLDPTRPMPEQFPGQKT